jgi:hypothetical protein
MNNFGLLRRLSFGRCFRGCLRETRVPELDRESFLNSPAGGVGGLCSAR